MTGNATSQPAKIVWPLSGWGLVGLSFTNVAMAYGVVLSLCAGQTGMVQ